MDPTFYRVGMQWLQWLQKDILLCHGLLLSRRQVLHSTAGLGRGAEGDRCVTVCVPWIFVVLSIEMDSSEYTRLKKARSLARGTSPYSEDVPGRKYGNGTVLFKEKVVNQCCTTIPPVPPVPPYSADNNVYVNGYYSTEATIYNADGSTTITLPSAGAYIIRYDPSGTAVWAARIGSTSDDQGYGCTTDSDKNVIVTGYYTSNPLPIYNQGGSLSSFSLPNLSDWTSSYIVKYSPSGAALWAAHVGGSSSSSIATDIYGVCTDSTNNIIISGYFTPTTVVFNQDGSTAKSLTTADNADIYIAKYNPSGTVLWATQIGGINGDEGYGIAIDSNDNIVCIGHYSSNILTVYNQDGLSTMSLSRTGTRDAYIIQYNPSGTAQWAAHIGGSSETYGYSIAIDSENNSIVTGYYTSPLFIYDQDGLSAFTLSHSGQNDVFIAKYDSSGTALWATRIAGSSFDLGYGVATDSSDTILVVGHYESTDLTIYNQDGGTTLSLPNTGVKKNAYIVKYDSTGTALWATYIEQATQSAVGRGITTDSDNNILVTGYYNNQEDLIIHNSTGGTISLTNTGTDQNDAFVVKYTPSGIAQWATYTPTGNTSNRIFNVNNIATS